jgi:hypothetical protein
MVRLASVDARINVKRCGQTSAAGVKRRRTVHYEQRPPHFGTTGLVRRNNSDGFAIAILLVSALGLSARSGRAQREQRAPHG